MLKFKILVQVFYVFIMITCLACKHREGVATNERAKMNAYQNREYFKSKAEFPQQFISQFPDTIASDLNGISTGYSPEKNNVYFFLYEYGKPVKEIDSIKKKVLDIAIATYSTIDTCLLVVNENESPKAFKKLNEQCLNAYPVPLFNAYRYGNNNQMPTRLDESFKIYVLEADTTDVFNFKIKANEMVNHKWRNGYSKGVSVSEEKRTIIYWSIAW